MANKLDKYEYPSGHSENDFECFGPPASQDAQSVDDFNGTMIADMGCFKQDGTDSNKFYHAAVVKSKTDGKWYVYFQWGRTGKGTPSFQFVACSSKEEAEREYAKQLYSKNGKRGEWINSKALGKKVLQAKKGKDCYLVRPQATRSTGLPDARSIKSTEGVDQTKVKNGTGNGDKKKTASKKSGKKIHPNTQRLMHDLNVATLSYTKGAMADDALPTQGAIDEARDILAAAQTRVGKIGDDTDRQKRDKQLMGFTTMLYGRVPKQKDLRADPSSWVLSKDNIFGWQQDLDAFEAALYAGAIDDAEVDDDPFGGMRLHMDWLDPKSSQGRFISEWLPSASRGKHTQYGHMRVKNVWTVEREDDRGKIRKVQERLLKQDLSSRDRPLHQPPRREDVSAKDAPLFRKTLTASLIHGTRSVNVSGILQKSLMLPRKLVGVQITGAMFGPGLYFADDWRKSAGYCSVSQSYWARGSGNIKGRGAFMFICDVVLGKPYVADGYSAYTSPPSGHHSVFGKAGRSGVMNNEFIVYNSDQHQLRWLVEFTC